MVQIELPPMAPGGEWLHSGGNAEPLYVVHEAHVKRLMSEGWRPIPDPRKPVEAKPAAPSEKDILMERLAAALARIEALEARNAPAQSADTSEPGHGADPGDSDTPAKPARKPKG